MEGPAIMDAYLGVGISLGEEGESDSALATPEDPADGFRSDTTVSRTSTTVRPARKYLKRVSHINSNFVCSPILEGSLVKRCQTHFISTIWCPICSWWTGLG